MIIIHYFETSLTYVELNGDVIVENGIGEMKLENQMSREA
jgi:hypothetical protein